MRNVMNHQNFTHYPYIMELIKEAEVLFENIQKMEKYAFSIVCLHVSGIVYLLYHIWIL